MRELRSEEIGDRRVALVETSTERYSVTIAVRGPHGTWEDISLQSDQNLGLHTALGHTSIPAGRVIAGQAALQAACANLLLFMSPYPSCDRSGLIPTNEGQFGLRTDTLWRWFEYTESAK